MLRQESIQEPAHARALAIIERNARAQAGLIGELLDISRIAAHKMELNLGLVDFGRIAQRAVEATLPAANDKHVTLSVDLSLRLLVLGDRARLMQVALNLLSNAVKFTPPGGIVVVRSAHKEGCAVLTITDTGRGIDPNSLEHVFECFHQCAEGIAETSGLGLGLYIVRQLVELHGGVVSAESEGHDRGSRFTVSLPVQTAFLRDEMTAE